MHSAPWTKPFIGFKPQEPSESPFFVWVHLFDPHGPYQPPPPWDTQYYEGGDPYDPTQVSMQQVDGVAYLKDDLEGITDVRWPMSQYAGEISYSDTQIGRLSAWLEANGLHKIHSDSGHR